MPSSRQAAAQQAFISFSSQLNVNSTEALIDAAMGLAGEGVARVVLCLSSFGGNFDRGVSLYNTLRGLPFELVTHNVGNVGSAANVLFLAGEQRYACPQAVFFFHPSSASLEGSYNPRELAEQAHAAARVRRARAGDHRAADRAWRAAHQGDRRRLDDDGRRGRAGGGGHPRDQRPDDPARGPRAEGLAPRAVTQRAVRGTKRGSEPAKQGATHEETTAHPSEHHRPASGRARGIAARWALPKGGALRAGRAS